MMVMMMFSNKNAKTIHKIKTNKLIIKIGIQNITEMNNYQLIFYDL